jgi:hypothetical protein
MCNLLLQGKYEMLPSRTVKLDLTTSSSGAFSLENPAAAAYTFKSNAGTECVDSVTSESYAGLFHSTTWPPFCSVLF